jgi:hypothetical protein
MAKKPKVEGAAPAAGHRKGKVRTFAELQSSTKGKMLLVARACFSLAKKNGWSGTILGNMKGKGSQNGAFYAASKNGSPFWNMPEDSDAFTSLRSLARAAQNDCASGTAGAGSNAYIDAFLGTRGGAGGKGGVAMNTAKVAGLDI